MESRGIIMFNRGDKCIVRAIVCLYTLRKWWHGPVTFYLENPMPQEFVEVCKYFNVDVIHNEEKHELKTLVRKTDMFCNPPYDRTLWVDSDTVIVGKIDEMFDYLDDYDVAIPNFAGWVSNGSAISKRIKRFEGIIDKKYIDEALRQHPAVNTGILSFKKSERWNKFVEYWVGKADLASQKRVFIADEVCFQVLYPSISEWGLKCFIAPTDFNVSVLHDHGKSKDIRVLHMHGQKHVLDHPNCEIWKNTFAEMRKNNVANINNFLQYADKRLAEYLQKQNGNVKDTTIVTACDEKYVEILRETFPNWRKYKKIDEYPVIVFVNDMDVKTDPRLDFLRLPNVRLIPWSKENDLDGVTEHREEMLSAFVFGAAKYVTTDYWLKLDADSYATDDRDFITDKMKNYAFCGHKWGYSRPAHIEALDNWAKGHWKRKLRRAAPMLSEGRIERNRFYHNKKRTISFIQLHKLKFTKFCVKLLKTRRLPAPTQDTFLYFVANRFNPETVGIMNFKKWFGFTQGRGKNGPQWFKERMAEIDRNNSK